MPLPCEHLRLVPQYTFGTSTFDNTTDVYHTLLFPGRKRSVWYTSVDNTKIMKLCSYHRSVNELLRPVKRDFMHLKSEIPSRKSNMFWCNLFCCCRLFPVTNEISVDVVSCPKHNTLSNCCHCGHENNHSSSHNNNTYHSHWKFYWIVGFQTDRPIILSNLINTNIWGEV